MGQHFLQWVPELFPVHSLYLVAPFWADFDIRGEQGNISHQVYYTGSPLLDYVSTIISDEGNIDFTGHWMLVAEWDSVPQFPHDAINQVSYINITISTCHHSQLICRLIIHSRQLW